MKLKARKWTWLDTVHHQLWDWTRFLGIRDRLRCPECKAVGTFKPHGGWIDVRLGRDVRGMRRWLCKYCGVYFAPDGYQHCYANPVKGYWVLEHEYEEDCCFRPSEVMKDICWSWRG